MGKKKLTQYSLLSGLVLTTLAAGQTVFADEAPVQNTTTDNQASEVATSGPQVKVISQTEEAGVTTTTSSVTSPELTQAVNDVNSFNESVAPSSANTTSDDQADASGVVIPEVKITEGDTKVYSTVEEADAANKAQAESINATLAAYQTDVANYKQALANYQAEQDAYVAAKAKYDEQVANYNDVQTVLNNLDNPDVVKAIEGMALVNEPNAVVSVSGVDQYITKEAQGRHVQEEILQQFNTDKYPESDLTSENPYAANEDTWFKMSVGDTVTAEYTNLENSDYLGSKISKIVTSYTLTQTTSNDNSAIVKLYHDPTKSIFVGAQTSDDPSKALEMDIQVKLYDENGKEINLAENNGVMSLGTLNHWTTEFGDHVEKIKNIGNNKFVTFGDSTIRINEDGAIYSPTENQYVANGSALNGDGEDGWDKINADGEVRTAKSIHGAGAMTYNGDPITLSVSGNNAEIPTAVWFAFNTIAAQKPEEAPQEPEKPTLANIEVKYDAAVVVAQTETPEEPNTPTPGEPTPPTPPTPTNTVTPTPVSSNTPAPEQPVPVAAEQELPETGDTSSYGVAVFGAGAVAFSVLTLLGSLKRKEN